jgi:hypothetical protein
MSSKEECERAESSCCTERGVLAPANPDDCSAGFEWKTRSRLFGLPVICVAFGCDERGKTKIAKGVIAVGQFALGVVAIGQCGIGLISLGQFAVGIAALGQLAVGLLTGWGQFAVGTFALGQVVVGMYAKGQMGWAEYLWSPGRTDMEAVAMFETILWLPRQDLATIADNLSFIVESGVDSLRSLFK